MASKRRVRRRSCTSKVRHVDQKSAAIHAGKLRHNNKTAYNTYHCKFCGGWHVGRPNAAQRQAWQQSKENKL